MTTTLVTDPGFLSRTDRVARRRAARTCATQVGQLLEPANVLAGHDHQTDELRSTDYDDVLVDVLGGVGGLTLCHVAGCPLRNCARVAFSGKCDALAGKPRQTLALIHVVPPLPDDFDTLHLWEQEPEIVVTIPQHCGLPLTRLGTPSGDKRRVSGLKRCPRYRTRNGKRLSPHGERLPDVWTTMLRPRSSGPKHCTPYTHSRRAGS